MDADAFFASVEQAMHPELKGRPVITGAERGIVSAASYEAKRLGVKRGVSLHEIKNICPECIFLPSDYETYSIFSKRMFEILRRFTPDIEEYSIDEAFADISGLRRIYRGSYGIICKQIQETIYKELDITVSIGVSLSKTLAKLASKYKKPAGITAIPGKYINDFLKKTSIDKIWGIGPNTTQLLNKYGIKTAYNFALKPETFAKKLIGKVGVEIWRELRGEVAYKIETEPKRKYFSISKTKTFTPSSKNPDFVFAQAVRNLESACIKARRFNLAAKGIILSLKRSDFRHDEAKAKFNYPSVSPTHISHILKNLFSKTYKIGTEYRATGVVLTNLKEDYKIQLPLFEDTLKITALEKVNKAIDQVNKRFGKHTLFIGNGLYLQSQHKEKRGEPTLRSQNLLKGETKRRHLNLPLLLQTKDYKPKTID